MEPVCVRSYKFLFLFLLPYFVLFATFHTFFHSAFSFRCTVHARRESLVFPVFLFSCCKFRFVPFLREGRAAVVRETPGEKPAANFPPDVRSKRLAVVCTIFLDKCPRSGPHRSIVTGAYPPPNHSSVRETQAGKRATQPKPPPALAAAAS